MSACTAGGQASSHSPYITSTGSPVAASSSVRSGAVVSWRANDARLAGSLATNRERRKSASAGIVWEVQPVGGVVGHLGLPHLLDRERLEGGGEDVRELSGVTPDPGGPGREQGQRREGLGGGEHRLARHETAEGVADHVHRPGPRGCHDRQQVERQLGERVGLGRDDLARRWGARSLVLPPLVVGDDPPAGCRQRREHRDEVLLAPGEPRDQHGRAPRSAVGRVEDPGRERPATGVHRAGRRARGRREERGSAHRGQNRRRTTRPPPPSPWEL